MSVYQVVGACAYRENPPGTVFEATLDTDVEARALASGRLLLLERRTPAIQPGSYRLPAGWSTPQQEE